MSRTGRPRIESKGLDDAVRDVLAGATLEATAEARGVSVPTLRRRLDEARGTTNDDGPRVYNRDTEDAWKLDDRILTARFPLAGVELIEGRAVAARGEAAFKEWLTRPFPDDSFAGDTLEATQALLGALIGRFERAGSGREASGLAEKIIAALGRVEQILARRPPPPKPDEVVESLRRLDAEAIAKIEEHLSNPIRAEEVA